ncbi:MAG: pseudaminic acid cytidylyltransferase [Lachnospiraceae bacterium]|nr:pseudaminic acid cytidylyltransferase [Lachnospiraceae bacterium]
MKTIAMITARGGSKRIPRKNVLPFCGKPIILYSIQAALESGIFDEVMVSTDDEEIARIAEKAGAKVPFMRSEKTSNDFASTADVIMEVIEEYQKRGEEFAYICCIYPTAPFITAEKLRTAYARLSETDADALIPVVRFSYPPQRALVMRDERLVFNMPEFMLSRSQDLDPWYHDAGQFYFLRTESFLRTGKLMEGEIIPFEVSEMEVQDIDTMTDWELAELKYQRM